MALISCSSAARAALALLLMIALSPGYASDDEPSDATAAALLQAWYEHAATQGSANRSDEASERALARARETITHASADASYALGVRFQRQVAQRFHRLDYEHFLLGVLDEAEDGTHLSDRRIRQLLNTMLLSTADRSREFVRRFARRDDVSAHQGIYYIDRTSPDVEIGREPDGTTVGCRQEAASSNDRDYRLEFTRLELDRNPRPAMLEQALEQCLAIDDDELIRGWRAALQAMQPGHVWDVVVPAPLAYGDEGVPNPRDQNKPIVEPGEALRFVIRLHDKR